MMLMMVNSVMVRNIPTTVAIVYLMKLFILCIDVLFVLSSPLLRIDAESKTKLQQFAINTSIFCTFLRQKGKHCVRQTILGCSCSRVFVFLTTIIFLFDKTWERLLLHTTRQMRSGHTRKHFTTQVQKHLGEATSFHRRCCLQQHSNLLQYPQNRTQTQYKTLYIRML